MANPKIAKVTVYDVDFGVTPSREQNPIIVRVDTDQGIYGAGEVGLAYGTGAKAGAAMVRALAERHLMGRDAFGIEAIWNEMYRESFWGQGGGPVVYGAMSALDNALWDIKGKALSVPVYELLGGMVNPTLRVYANGWVRGKNAPEEYAEGALAIKEDGYTALKMDPFMIAPDGSFDFPPRHLTKQRADLAVARIRAVREAVGDDFDICVEVHGSLGTTDAIAVGRRLAEYRPFFYEEPVDAMNVESMRKVADNVPIPIAAGERLYTRYGFRPFIEAQALDILQPDMGLAGGLTEIRKIAAAGETYNLHVQPHNCGAPLATAASVQLDASITNFIIQELFPYWPDGRYDIVTDPIERRVVNGHYSPDARPGLGVELNDEYLGRFDTLVVT